MRKTALFIDFDNTYSGLRDIDPRAAERFATDPQRWLSWLEGDPDDPERRILVRRCFMNPRAFHKYRPDFVRAAFSVVDCPPLTAQGKTSTDVYVVMAMLDALAELPHLDEFVLFSADADFTPVLLRLRAHDKRTAALTVGPASSAYTAASDLVFAEEEFIEEALGLDVALAPRTERQTAPTGNDDTLRRMADRLYAEASTLGELEATALPAIYKQFTEFREGSNWLGFYGLRPLTEAVARKRPDLTLTQGDAWRVIVIEPEDGASPEAPESLADLADVIAEEVRRLVDASSEPVVLASAAHGVLGAVGPQVTETKWAGAGTFKALLEMRPELGLEVVTGPGSPGFVYDPERHERPELAQTLDRLADLPPELADFIRRIHGVTQVPALSPDEYGAVFDAIAEAVAEEPYQLTTTSRLVRDLVIERGYSVPRKAVSFILKGLYYRQFDFEGEPDGDDVADAFRDNVLHLADDAHVELDEHQEALLDDWLLTVPDDDPDSDDTGEELHDEEDDTGDEV